MEKIKLPREVAEAIDFVKHTGSHHIIENVVNPGELSTREIMVIRHHFRKDWRLLAEALINGYEVEETPEERIKKQYQLWGRDAELLPESSLRYNGMRIGMKDTLDMLGIKIKGVNT